MVIPLELLLLSADEAGVRLEMVGGVPLWESQPGYPHQLKLKQIEASLQPGRQASPHCGCFSIQDTYLRFPDGSFKRPDLMIFCRQPPVTGDAIEQLPEAVVEVISRGSEHKDLVVGPPFYLAQGIADVVVVDPEKEQVYHFTPRGEKRLASPTRIELACGCTLEA